MPALTNTSLSGFHSREEFAEILMQANASLEAAQAQDWERASELVMRWQLALSAFFDRLSPELKHTIDQTTVLELINVNERLIALVKQGRDSTAEQIKQFTHGRRAINAYHGELR